MSPFQLCGTVIHMPEKGREQVIEDALVAVDGEGYIARVLGRNDPDYQPARQRAVEDGQLLELSSGQYLLPGLVDLHIHAPQFPQLGKALHLPLEDWLQQCTFPIEARYSDSSFAEKVYTALVDSLLANGTTTALYFATIHLESTRLLADICLEKGQRALVGRVAMDNQDQCPDYYCDATTAQGLDETRVLVEYVRALNGNAAGLVKPVVTPRFIPSCTDELLRGLAAIAGEYDCHVQTHCSESDWQHAYVLDRHGRRDAESLDDFQLLTRKTILAHSNFINDEDMTIIGNRQSGIAHCPLSNYYFSNAVFPARKALDRGLHVGLGTDMSAGPNPSLLHNCAMAVTSSRALEEGVNPELPPAERGSPGARIDFREAFWMATTGGGLALDEKIGLLQPGYAMDAIVVDTTVSESNLRLWDEVDDVEDVLQKVIYNAGRENIANVWVQGRKVK